MFSWFRKDNDKLIYIDVSAIKINRYLYSFLKMFALQGYTVVIPKNREIIKILRKSKGEFRYASWLLKEGVLKFGKPNKITNSKSVISANQLSNNFFNNKTEVNSYKVPMCCYPAFYRNYQQLNSIEPQPKRKKSVFMAGNMDPDHYGRIDSSRYFTQPSRSKLAQFLKKQNYFEPIKNLRELNKFIDNRIDNKLILIDTKDDFRIELPELLNVLSSFRFFLAMPGITIPQSHNLIEAMACGCIPIIHKEYALLMNPPLENAHNAFIFSDLENLHLQLQNIFKEPNELLFQMEKNVNIYYSTYLTPEAVVNSVLNKNLEKIYIQAEHISLQLLDN